MNTLFMILVHLYMYSQRSHKPLRERMEVHVSLASRKQTSSISVTSLIVTFFLLVVN